MFDQSLEILPLLTLCRLPTLSPSFTFFCRCIGGSSSLLSVVVVVVVGGGKRRLVVFDLGEARAVRARLRGQKPTFLVESGGWPFHD